MIPVTPISVCTPLTTVEAKFVSTYLLDGDGKFRSISAIRKIEKTYFFHFINFLGFNMHPSYWEKF